MSDESVNSAEPSSDDAVKIENISEVKPDLAAELEKSRTEYLYLRAEFDNYKKQMIKERSDYLKYGSERLIVALLDVSDNLSRALELEIDPKNKQSIESFKKGLELTASEFKTTFKRFGVEEIDCAGKPFDPHQHEALGSVESEAVPPGHIAQVFKAAYKLHDRIIRPAQVMVAKEKS